MDSHSIPVRLSSDQIAWVRRYVEVAYANSAPPTRSDLLRRWIEFGTKPDLANLTPAQQQEIGPYPTFLRKDGINVEAEKHQARTEGNRKRAAAASGRRSPPARAASPRHFKATRSKPQKGKGRIAAG